MKRGDGNRQGPPPTQRVRVSDVARAANVSTSAVSRTFTEGASVAPETRARVLVAAGALGYRPNALARGLITQKTRLIAVIMANLGSPFFAGFLDTLNAELDRLGFSMLLLLPSGRDAADEAIEKARDYSVDGIVLLTAAPSAAAAARAEAAGIPLVILDRGRGAPTSAIVWIDGHSIGRRVAERFIAEGRKRPVAVSAFKGSPQPQELTAFAHRLRKAGIAAPRLELGLDYEDGLRAGRTLFAGDAPPDAIFAATDALACGLFDAAKHIHGIDIPTDLSIVGVGDVQQTRWMSYPISTVRLPIAILAKTAVDILARRISAPQTEPGRTLIDCEIMWRTSTVPQSSEPDDAARR